MRNTPEDARMEQEFELGLFRTPRIPRSRERRYYIISLDPSVKYEYLLMHEDEE
jgi:hypothetical protein